MAGLLEKISRNFGLKLATPLCRSSSTRLASSTTPSSTAMISTAPWNSKRASRAPPRKKPTPLSAFLEPVSRATQRYSVPWASSRTRLFTLLLALILLRSLAMPESACATITQSTVNRAGSTSSISRATICRVRPMCMVTFRPMRLASQPPNRLVTMPKNSYSRNSEATSSGLKPRPWKNSTTSMRRAPSVRVKAQ